MVQHGIAQTLTAPAVVLALPPRLAAHSLRFDPPLPPALHQTLRAVPTWMSHAMKSVAVYAEPFWRAAGWSGFAISQVGPLGEIHYASPASGPLGALFGFFEAGHPLRAAPAAARQAAVLAQLARLFGPPAAAPLAYHELDWTLEPLTSVPGDERRPRRCPCKARPCCTSRTGPAPCTRPEPKRRPASGAGWTGPWNRAAGRPGSCRGSRPAAQVAATR